MAAVPSIGRASLVDRPHVAPHAEATHGLYERHAAKIQAYCHHQLGSREEAEDAVQTTFMNAFRALGRGVVPEAETAWLFKIAENVCLSRRRSSWRRGRIESPSDFDVIEAVVPGPSRQRDELIGIEDALASMPEQQRRAILLREWQGLSYREIAEELEVSQSAVETLIFRARRSLAQGLEQPETLKRPRRKVLRRALRALDFGSIAAAAKTLLAGGAAAKATAAAAVAVTAAAGTGATVVAKHHEGHSPKSSPAPIVAKAVPAPAEAPASVRFASPAASSSPRGSAAAPVAAPAATAPKPQVAPAAPAAAIDHPAPASPAPQAEPLATPSAPAPAPAPPVAEPKNDEGQSDRTERRPEAVAPVAPTPTPTPTPAPAPASAQPVPTETTGGGRGTTTTEPVLVTTSPKPTVEPSEPTPEPTPATTTSPRGSTSPEPLQPAPSKTAEPTTTTSPIVTETTTPSRTAAPTSSFRGNG